MSLSKKSATMSFRFDVEVLKKLKDESEKQNISLNTLANQIFKRYVEWDRFESKVGMVPVAKPILGILFKNLDEKETIKLATEVGRDIIGDITVFMKGSMDVESFLSWFETRMNASAFEINHTIKNSTHMIIVKHDVGYNWSLYHKTILELIFTDILEKKIDVEINDRMMKILVDY